MRIHEEETQFGFYGSVHIKAMSLNTRLVSFGRNGQDVIRRCSIGCEICGISTVWTFVFSLVVFALRKFHFFKNILLILSLVLYFQGTSQSMPWLAELVQSSEGSLDVLPVQCLCEFLLLEKTGEKDKEEGFSKTLSEKRIVSSIGRMFYS